MRLVAIRGHKCCLRFLGGRSTYSNTFCFVSWNILTELNQTGSFYRKANNKKSIYGYRISGVVEYSAGLYLELHWYTENHGIWGPSIEFTVYPGLVKAEYRISGRIKDFFVVNFYSRFMSIIYIKYQSQYPALKSGQPNITLSLHETEHLCTNFE